MEGGADVAEVAGVDDDFDVWILGGDLLEDGDGCVLGAVIDEDVLVAVAADAEHDLADLIVEVEDVVLLVVAGGHDGDGFLGDRRGHGRGETQIPFGNDNQKSK